MMQQSQARERVLEAAERLFAERGYTAVTIKDIAGVAGIHHASLYHHAPQGKSQLFVEVTERTIYRHQQGIAAAVAAGEGLHDQLSQIAAWILSQPPMDMIRMVHSDVPALDAASGSHLLMLAHTAILEPIAAVLHHAHERGEICHADFGNVAGSIFSMIEGLFTLPDAYLHRSRLSMAEEMIRLLLDGLRAH
jgi:AcrR family transcriptional regulator